MGHGGTKLVPTEKAAALTQALAAQHAGRWCGLSGVALVVSRDLGVGVRIWAVPPAELGHVLYLVRSF